MTLYVNSRLEDGLVDPTDPTTLGFRHQINGLQPRLVRYVHAQFLHARLVVAVRRRLILTLSLPRDYDDPVDAVLVTEIDHPDGLFDEVVVDDGATVKGRLSAAIYRQIGSSVLPVLPQVALVVQPRVVMERQIFNASGDGIDLKEFRSAVALVRTSEEGGPHCNSPMPRDRVNANVSRCERMIQVMSPFCVFVHVATEDLGIEVVAIAIGEPDESVVAVRQSV